MVAIFLIEILVWNYRVRELYTGDYRVEQHKATNKKSFEFLQSFVMGKMKKKKQLWKKEKPLNFWYFYTRFETWGHRIPGSSGQENLPLYLGSYDQYQDW